MRKALGVLGICGVLVGCGAFDVAPAGLPADSDGQTRPQSRPDVAQAEVQRPRSTARTVDEFDTTSSEQRAAAAAGVEGTAEQALGPTIVSLGNAAQPGFWLATPLVRAPAQGRVVYPPTGKSVQVDLIPVADGGSRLSLPAMRLIDVPLTGLVEVEVFSAG